MRPYLMALARRVLPLPNKYAATQAFPSATKTHEKKEYCGSVLKATVKSYGKTNIPVFFFRNIKIKTRVYEHIL